MVSSTDDEKSSSTVTNKFNALLYQNQSNNNNNSHYVDESDQYMSTTSRCTSKFIRYNIKSKSFSIVENVENLNRYYNVSICYDGEDHIYMIGGGRDSMPDATIESFNLHSSILCRTKQMGTIFENDEIDRKTFGSIII
ncbi:hypothetical protein PPL_08483 [Heterostelium album PN500]|uniref:Uncharacterized protein n=1 Tax=Heterostelium pallidum (strain ATCC 26659 / Pp 5 / PN500) TaxID=670386 RepID=D3BIB5_HETP5|nr:hypothetical protein PPL_08483 [Heterostelium album PN500]EFA79015.1 hypothetical protein PPL_08483 [Heterostelium album PN500]|eukprot:XP_020431138.1 hypothetical protein PPL_08483 [Heterostelium album PN500]